MLMHDAGARMLSSLLCPDARRGQQKVGPTRRPGWKATGTKIFRTVSRRAEDQPRPEPRMLRQHGPVQASSTAALLGRRGRRRGSRGRQGSAGPPGIAYRDRRAAPELTAAGPSQRTLAITWA